MRAAPSSRAVSLGRNVCKAVLRGATGAMETEKQAIERKSKRKRHAHWGAPDLGDLDVEGADSERGGHALPAAKQSHKIVFIVLAPATITGRAVSSGLPTR